MHYHSINKVLAFKNELKNYRFYQERIEALNDLIDICYYNLTGVKGVQSDKIPSSTNPELAEDARYRVYDEIDRHKRNKAITQAKLDEINEILDQLEEPIKKALIAIYADGESYEKISQEMYLSKSALFEKLETKLKDAID
jgi:DNA-directed RNA polymerase specialized sigma24 family protein